MSQSEPHHSVLKTLVLYPMSLCYGAVVLLRNKLFDFDLIKSRRFVLPIISIGNLSVGGTGKTPHSEYVIQLLQQRWRVALLSRGYRRKTRGFVLGGPDSTAENIGDEPYQILSKFPRITVAVDEKRVHGIEQLQQLPLPPEVVVLDDAYQHRYVTPGLSILLIDYHHLANKDFLMPLGRLREPMSNSDRADIIIISKCPANIKPVEMMTMRKEISPFPFQSLYFSTYMYTPAHALFEKSAAYNEVNLSDFDVLSVSAIAQPGPFHQHLMQHSMSLVSLDYADHHFFTVSDYEQIRHRFDSIHSERKIIVVTEKDSARLVNDSQFPSDLKPYIYCISIKVRFLNYGNVGFDEQLIDFVKKGKHNRLV